MFLCVTVQYKLSFTVVMIRGSLEPEIALLGVIKSIVLLNFLMPLAPLLLTITVIVEMIHISPSFILLQYLGANSIYIVILQVL